MSGNTGSSVANEGSLHPTGICSDRMYTPVYLRVESEASSFIQLICIVESE